MQLGYEPEIIDVLLESMAKTFPAFPELSELLYYIFSRSTYSRLQSWCDRSDYVGDIVQALQFQVMEMLLLEGWEPVGPQASPLAQAACHI